MVLNNPFYGGSFMNRDGNWFDKSEENPLDSETHARVISFQPPLNEVIALTENGLYLVKLRSVKTIKHFEMGQQVCISIDENERDEIESVLRMVRYNDLSGQGKNDLSQIIGEIILDKPEAYLSFFNRAQHLSRKMHSFGLLPALGQKLASQLAEMRGRGWGSLEEVDLSLKQIRPNFSVETLLAERFIQEMENPQDVPRLIDLLLRRDV